LSFDVFVIWCLCHLMYLSFDVFVIWRLCHLMYLSFDVFVIWCLRHLMYLSGSLDVTLKEDLYPLTSAQANTSTRPHAHTRTHTYECVISRMDAAFYVWTSHIKYEWVTSHTWMSHVTHWWGMAEVWYGVATISRLLKIMGLFCKRAL